MTNPKNVGPLAKAFRAKLSKAGDAAMLEFLYLNREWDALETLRQFSLLGADSRERVLQFVRGVNALEGPEIVETHEGLAIRPKAETA